MWWSIIVRRSPLKFVMSLKNRGTYQIPGTVSLSSITPFKWCCRHSSIAPESAVPHSRKGRLCSSRTSRSANVIDTAMDELDMTPGSSHKLRRIFCIIHLAYPRPIRSMIAIIALNFGVELYLLPIMDDSFAFVTIHKSLSRHSGVCTDCGPER